MGTLGGPSSVGSVREWALYPTTPSHLTMDCEAAAFEQAVAAARVPPPLNYRGSTIGG